MDRIFALIVYTVKVSWFNQNKSLEICLCIVCHGKGVEVIAMVKSGTEYELFVNEVYECLNRADGLSDVQIQHDIMLVGAAGVKHQIDVFWIFTKGGVAYKVAVECKDYKAHVSKEKSLRFMIFSKI